MLRAVFVRTLKPEVTYEQFKQAWVPQGLEGYYPAKARVARNVANDRQVLTIIEVDAPPAEFKAASASLTRPDAVPRLGDIIEADPAGGHLRGYLRRGVAVAVTARVSVSRALGAGLERQAPRDSASRRSQ